MEKSSAHHKWVLDEMNKGISVTTSWTSEMEQWQKKNCSWWCGLPKEHNEWPMGVVVDSVSDNDGIVWSAKSQIGKLQGDLSQEMVWPVNKLVLLLQNKKVQFPEEGARWLALDFELFWNCFETLEIVLGFVITLKWPCFDVSLANKVIKNEIITNSITF